jgi:predicted kinase
MTATPRPPLQPPPTPQPTAALILIALAGPPGTGKSTLAAPLARALGAAIVSVDPIEDGLLAAGVPADRAGLAAYLAAERVAEQNLAAGIGVVIDAVNDHPLARGQWVDLAERTGAVLRFAELVPPSADEHRARLEGRGRRFRHLPEPAWTSLPDRAAALAAWDGHRMRLPAAEPPDRLLARVLAALDG